MNTQVAVAADQAQRHAERWLFEQGGPWRHGWLVVRDVHQAEVFVRRIVARGIDRHHRWRMVRGLRHLSVIAATQDLRALHGAFVDEWWSEVNDGPVVHEVRRRARFAPDPERGAAPDGYVSDGT